MPDGEHSRSLCIFCGEDAPRYNLHKCPSCGRRPQTAHEVAYAFAYSSAVLGEEQLDLITEQMRRGEPGPTLKGETYDYFLELANGIDLDHLFSGIASKEGRMH